LGNLPRARSLGISILALRRRKVKKSQAEAVSKKRERTELWGAGSFLVISGGIHDLARNTNLSVLAEKFRKVPVE
jgi:hypothetical protein